MARRQSGRRRGTVVPRTDGTWLVRATLGYDAEGKRQRVNETVRGTKSDAERRLTAILQQADRGGPRDCARLTLGDWLTEWQRDWCNDLSERTRGEYRAVLRRYLPPTLLSRRLDQVSIDDVQKVVNAMQQRGLAPRTIQYLRAILRSALFCAMKTDKLVRNVASRVTLPRPSRRDVRTLSPSETRGFLAAAAGTRYEALFAVLVTGGLRPSEALALRWTDVDDDRLHVQRTLLRPRGGGWRLSEPKTSRSRRVVVVPASTAKLLARHRTQQGVERLRAGAEYQRHDLVFATELGAPLDLHNIGARVFKPLLKAAGLPAIRLYDLRHSAATLRLANGENPKIVSEMLGHSTVTLTLDTYSHVLPDMQRDSAARVDRLIFGTGT